MKQYALFKCCFTSRTGLRLPTTCVYDVGQRGLKKEFSATKGNKAEAARGTNYEMLWNY